MISIRLAFGIDALRVPRQLRLEEGDALAALKAEFTANLTAIERVIAFHTRHRELARGRDVLVHPENVARVVLLLDVGKTRIAGPVVLFGICPVVGRLEVDVATLTRERRRGLVVVPHPLDVGLGVLRIGPYARDDRGEVGVPVSERGCVGIHVMDGAVDRMDVHRRLDHRDLGAVLEVRVDEAVAQLLHEVRLPVVLQACWGGRTPS